MDTGIKVGYEGKKGQELCKINPEPNFWYELKDDLINMPKVTFKVPDAHPDAFFLCASKHDGRWYYEVIKYDSKNRVFWSDRTTHLKNIVLWKFLHNPQENEVNSYDCK